MFTEHLLHTGCAWQRGILIALNEEVHTVLCLITGASPAESGLSPPSSWCPQILYSETKKKFLYGKTYILIFLGQLSLSLQQCGRVKKPKVNEILPGWRQDSKEEEGEKELLVTTQSCFRRA